MQHAVVNCGPWYHQCARCFSKDLMSISCRAQLPTSWCFLKKACCVPSCSWFICPVYLAWPSLVIVFFGRRLAMPPAPLNSWALHAISSLHTNCSNQRVGFFLYSAAEGIFEKIAAATFAWSVCMADMTLILDRSTWAQRKSIDDILYRLYLFCPNSWGDHCRESIDWELNLAQPC